MSESKEETTSHVRKIFFLYGIWTPLLSHPVTHEYNLLWSYCHDIGSYLCHTFVTFLKLFLSPNCLYMKKRSLVPNNLQTAVNNHNYKLVYQLYQHNKKHSSDEFRFQIITAEYVPIPNLQHCPRPVTVPHMRCQWEGPRYEDRFSWV
jgi:hypothetical protein